MLSQGQKESLRTAIWRGNPFVFLDILKVGERVDYEEAVALILSDLRRRLDIGPELHLHFVAHILADGTFFYHSGPSRGGVTCDTLQREGTMENHPLTMPEQVDELQPSTTDIDAIPVAETAMFEAGPETAMLPQPAAKQRKPRNDKGKPRGAYKPRDKGQGTGE